MRVLWLQHMCNNSLLNESISNFLRTSSTIKIDYSNFNSIHAILLNSSYKQRNNQCFQIFITNRIKILICYIVLPNLLGRSKDIFICIILGRLSVLCIQIIFIESATCDSGFEKAWDKDNNAKNKCK